MPPKRLLFVLGPLLLLGGVAVGVYQRPFRPDPVPVVLLNGAQLKTGDRELPPEPVLTMRLVSGQHVGDYAVTVDGNPVAITRRGELEVTLAPPRLSQGAWHSIRVDRN